MQIITEFESKSKWIISPNAEGDIASKTRIPIDPHDNSWNERAHRLRPSVLPILIN